MPVHGGLQSERGQAITRFPEPLPGGALDGVLYTLGRATLFGLPFLRVATFVVLLIAVAWMLRPMAGGIWVAAGIMVAMLVPVLLRMLAARRNFVRFAESADEGQGAVIAPAALHASEKVPVYLWGDMEVQGRVRAYAALPGFYRTFATREHAFIGLVVSTSRLGFARLPDLDAGLWYAFCTPAQVLSLRRGVVLWGARRYPAIAIERHTERRLSTGRSRRGVEMLYIATRDGEALNRIWADLMVDRERAVVAHA